MTPNEINGGLLAYVGDAVIERLVRKKLVLDGGKLGEINKTADALVRAGYQSRAGERILPLLSEEELAAYRRGKNFHFSSVPKNASQGEYKKATALEALFGYLDILGETERIEYFFKEAFFPDEEK